MRMVVVINGLTESYGTVLSQTLLNTMKNLQYEHSTVTLQIKVEYLSTKVHTIIHWFISYSMADFCSYEWSIIRKEAVITN